MEVGKLADLVLYQPAFFGTKPDIVMKGGLIAYAQMGDANASIPTPQPVISRPMFGTHPSVLSKNCCAFVSKVSQETVKTYNLNKMVRPVFNTRSVTKHDMKHNSYLPDITVDPESYKVVADGEHLDIGPSSTVPMSQGVYLF